MFLTLLLHKTCVKNKTLFRVQVNDKVIFFYALSVSWTRAIALYVYIFCLKLIAAAPSVQHFLLVLFSQLYFATASRSCWAAKWTQKCRRKQQELCPHKKGNVRYEPTLTSPSSPASCCLANVRSVLEC